MGKKTSSYKTVKTPDGTVFHLYTDENGKSKPHCQTGPAVIYPKSIKKPDEYYIYGIKYEYPKWLELSRIAKRSSGDIEDFTE
jgi:hypothetical protein